MSVILHVLINECSKTCRQLIQTHYLPPGKKYTLATNQMIPRPQEFPAFNLERKSLVSRGVKLMQVFERYQKRYFVRFSEFLNRVNIKHECGKKYFIPILERDSADDRLASAMYVSFIRVMPL